MTEGKAYANCLRACLLTDAALHLTLLHTDIEVHQKRRMKNKYLIMTALRKWMWMTISSLQ